LVLTNKDIPPSTYFSHGVARFKKQNGLSRRLDWKKQEKKSYLINSTPAIASSNSRDQA
jgi:hypothetical protein